MHFKRHELKYYLNDVQTDVLKQQLSCLMSLDRHSAGQDGYRVRSLYFDSIDDECLYQKQSGLLNRSKIRLRTYGCDGDQIIKFEIKRKQGQLVKKDSAVIKREDAERVCHGEHERLLGYDNSILNEIYATFTTRAYRPKVIVEYQRVAFVFSVSDVRITFDLNLRSNINHLDLLSPIQDTMPVVLEGKQILEVKYNEFLPKHFKKVLSGVAAERMAISKYTLARRFHKVHKWEDN